MKYQCLNPKCKRQFTHTASKSFTDAAYIFEYKVCPYCEERTFDLIQDADISSLVDVKPEEFDAKYLEGYRFFKDYSGKIRMVKRK